MPYRPDEGQVNMKTLRKKKNEVKKAAERNRVRLSSIKGILTIS